MNALATATYSAATTSYDNRTNLFMWGEFVLAVTYAVAPTANTTVDLYLVPSVDNSTYADGGGAVAPSINYYAGSFTLRAVTTAQKIAIRGAVLPPDLFKVVVFNGAGQAMPATGTTVQMNPYKI
jgi:hypothetical protein